MFHVIPAVVTDVSTRGVVFTFGLALRFGLLPLLRRQRAVTVSGAGRKSAHQLSLRERSREQRMAPEEKQTQSSAPATRRQQVCMPGTSSRQQMDLFPFSFLKDFMYMFAFMYMYAPHVDVYEGAHPGQKSVSDSSKTQ